ncbi:hypothetical protein DBV15_06914 [Temnothorax longispinosus]|uniref:Uncharacterized protein n=1 Tax=Temnothorax longispinosus TaxID=300112 RepID=A0A4S2KLY7_9HYME|nr:hypothetical protein DBV15_06914 [Temnothorax longispinosus]
MTALASIRLNKTSSDLPHLNISAYVQLLSSQTRENPRGSALRALLHIFDENSRAVVTRNKEFGPVYGFPSRRKPECLLAIGYSCRKFVTAKQRAAATSTKQRWPLQCKNARSCNHTRARLYAHGEFSRDKSEQRKGPDLGIRARLSEKEQLSSVRSSVPRHYESGTKLPIPESTAPRARYAPRYRHTRSESALDLTIRADSFALAKKRDGMSFGEGRGCGGSGGWRRKQRSATLERILSEDFPASEVGSPGGLFTTRGPHNTARRVDNRFREGTAATVPVLPPLWTMFERRRHSGNQVDSQSAHFPHRDRSPPTSLHKGNRLFHAVEHSRSQRDTKSTRLWSEYGFMSARSNEKTGSHEKFGFSGLARSSNYLVYSIYITYTNAYPCPRRPKPPVPQRRRSMSPPSHRRPHGNRSNYRRVSGSTD